MSIQEHKIFCPVMGSGLCFKNYFTKKDKTYPQHLQSYSLIITQEYF